MAWDQDFLDTFLGYPIASATSLGKWTSQNTFNSAVGEDGSQCLGSPNHLSKVLAGSSRGRMVGLRGKMTQFGGGVTTVMRIVDSAGTMRMGMTYLENPGVLRIEPPDSAGSTQAVITSATAFPSNNSWQTLEMMAFYSGALATWEVRLNGVTVADLSGSIANAQTPTLQHIQLGSGGSSPGLVANSHIWSKKATATFGVPVSGDWLGNVQRGILRPDAEGTNYPASAGGARWTPNAGTTYFAELDETLADEATSYIKNTTAPTASAADKASWRYSNPVSTLQTVKMVQRQTLLRLSVGSAATFKMGLGITGSINDIGIVRDTLASNFPSSYLFHLTQYPLDPRDSGVWTKAKLDNLDGMVELVSLTP